MIVASSYKLRALTPRRWCVEDGATVAIHSTAPALTQSDMSGDTCCPGGSATDDAIPSFAAGRSAPDRPGPPDGSRARGHDDVGRAHHAGVPLARSRGDRGHYHAVHGALRAARRACEAYAGGDQHPEPGRVVDSVEGWARVRIRAPQGDDVPQRRADH